MNLTTRLERLERICFPRSRPGTILWTEFLFVHALQSKYGGAVEQHISGLKLYEYQRLSAQIAQMYESRSTPSSPAPAVTAPKNKSKTPPKSAIPGRIKRNAQKSPPESVLR